MNLEDFIQKDIVPINEKAEKPKKLTIFDIIDAASKYKTDLEFNDDTVVNAYDQYMINRWLSMEIELTFLAEMLNTCNNLTDEQHFKMIKAALQQKKYHLSYIKRKKDLTEKEKRYIAHYFEIGLRDAHDYIKQMDEDEIIEILDTYKYGKNEMIKV